MKIINADKELESKIKESVSIPYVKIKDNNSMEIGYCTIEVLGEVKDKHILLTEKQLKNIKIKSYDKETYTPVFISKTIDGYLRFWIDNPRYFLRWVTCRDKEDIILESKRK